MTTEIIDLDTYVPPKRKTYPIKSIARGVKNGLFFQEKGFLQWSLKKRNFLEKGSTTEPLKVTRWQNSKTCEPDQQNGKQKWQKRAPRVYSEVGLLYTGTVFNNITSFSFKLKKNRWPDNCSLKIMIKCVYFVKFCLNLCKDCSFKGELHVKTQCIYRIGEKIY